MAAANARSPLSEPPEAQLPPLDRLSLHDKPAVPITQLACMIEGHHTEVLCCVYSDRVVLFVTQLMKPGTIVEASRDTEGSGIAQYSQATLLGRRDDPCIDLISRQLAEWFGARTSKELLLCFGLLPVPEDRIRAVVDAVLDACLAVAAW